MSGDDSIQENPISRSSGDREPEGPGRVVSDEERDGVSDTDMEPEPALGVGESINRRGESFAKDAEATKGASDRPVGRAEGSDTETGVDPQDSVTEGSPDLQAGDQGG